MEKVKLPKLAAEAIELMRAKGAPNNEIIERHFNKDHIPVKGYKSVASLSTHTLIRALYFGFEIEQTPEDKVRELFKNPGELYEGIGELSTSYRNAIIDTLNTLGITIPGVNGGETDAN